MPLNAFRRALLPRVPIDGKPLVADAVVADLYGDGRSCAVAWNEEALFLVVPKAAR